MYEGFNISDDDIAMLAAHGLKPIAGAQEPSLADLFQQYLAGQSGGGSGPQPYEVPSAYQYPDTFVGRQVPGSGQSLQPGSLTIDPNSGMVVFWNGTSFSLAPEYVQKAFGGLGGTAGGGTGDTALDYAKFDEAVRQFNEELKLKGINAGLDSESSRRQALASLIQNRNNTAVDTANISNDVAKTAAQFAANPRDAFAELFYRNQVGGSTPFGDMTNDNFGEYGKALADKAQSIFQPVGNDINQLRTYRDAIPPTEFFGPETRNQLGLPPTTAQSLLGSTAGGPAAAPAAPTNRLQALMDQLNGMNDQQKADFRKWTTAGQAPAAMAKGGSLDFEGMFANRGKPGFSPSSSEGGTNLNIHERAVVVGESGQIYATLGEKRPDGSMRAEQLQIKPLKSEVAKDKKLEEGNKAVVESQKKTLAAFDQGGSVTTSPDDLMQQLSQYLNSLGGSGGGTGASGSSIPSLRLLAGSPWDSLEQDPVAMDYALAGYSAMGIDPRTVASTVAKFTPNSAQRVGQTAPRVSFA